MQRIAELDCLISGASPTQSRIVLLHGRGASAEDLFSLGDHLPARAQGIFPQGPERFPPGFEFGWAWYGLPPDDRQGVERSADLLEKFLDEIIRGDEARAARTILGGFSQGAVMTLDVGLRYRPKLGGLVAMSGYLFDESRAFSGIDGLDTPPVCLVHGSHDEVVDVSRGRKAHDVLLKRGVDVRYQEFPMGHEINGESWGFVSRFLEERVG